MIFIPEVHMNKFESIIADLEAKIEASYTEGVTLEEAEKLAGRFLHAQMQVSGELRKADLNSRMRKSGLKAVKAAVYMDIIAKSEKKPTESQMDHMINTNELVSPEQDALDLAETSRDELERLFGVFQAAHVHFRQMSKGQFNG
jgi:hypothetical protein